MACQYFHHPPGTSLVSVWRWFLHRVVVPCRGIRVTHSIRPLSIRTFWAPIMINSSCAQRSRRHGALWKHQRGVGMSSSHLGDLKTSKATPTWTLSSVLTQQRLATLRELLQCPRMDLPMGWSTQICVSKVSRVFALLTRLSCHSLLADIRKHLPISSQKERLILLNPLGLTESSRPIFT